MQESKCEINAIPAAFDVSFPYALGITIVPSPSGIAREQTVQITIVSDGFHRAKTPIKASGIKSRRMAVVI